MNRLRNSINNIKEEYHTILIFSVELFQCIAKMNTKNTEVKVIRGMIFILIKNNIHVYKSI